MSCVKKIIKDHLIAKKYDGLCSQDEQCGCEVSDLAPCGQMGEDCEPGYKVPDPSGEADFLITTEKPE